MPKLTQLANSSKRMRNKDATCLTVDNSPYAAETCILSCFSHKSMIFTSTIWLKHISLLYSHLQGPFAWSLISPSMHHCPSRTAVPSLSLLVLLPLFPHTRPQEKFAERSHSEAPAGGKLRPPFIKKKFQWFWQDYCILTAC